MRDFLGVLILFILTQKAIFSEIEKEEGNSGNDDEPFCLDQDYNIILARFGKKRRNQCIYVSAILSKGFCFTKICLQNVIEYWNKDCGKGHVCYASCSNSKCLNLETTQEIVELKSKYLGIYLFFSKIFGPIVLTLLLTIYVFNSWLINRAVRRIEVFSAFSLNGSMSDSEQGDNSWNYLSNIENNEGEEDARKNLSLLKKESLLIR